MKKPPRPLTEEERTLATAMLAAGMTRTSAAQYAGCRRYDLDAEIQRDPEFKQQVRRSELQPELNALRGVLKAAREPGQWRAAAWALERLYPRRYSARRRNGVPRGALQKFMAKHGSERELRRTVKKNRAAEGKRAQASMKTSARAKARSTRRK
jgi:hypothetical protein